MSRVRNKCCLALVSRHSTAPGRDETFAKIWGMDDPSSTNVHTDQRGVPALFRDPTATLPVLGASLRTEVVTEWI